MQLQSGNHTRDFFFLVTKGTENKQRHRVTWNSTIYPYLDNPFSHRVQYLLSPIPTLTHMNIHKHTVGGAPIICVMVRLPSSYFVKVSKMQFCYLVALHLTWFFVNTSIRLRWIYLYITRPVLDDYIDRFMIYNEKKRIILSVLNRIGGELTSLSSSSSSSSDSGPSSSTVWRTGQWSVE